jgi:DNA repair photolyase
MSVREETGGQAVRNYSDGGSTVSSDRLTARPFSVLDQRRRGTKFVSLPIASVLNSPAQTGMDFWSVNPFVGCEFGCSYCYARFTHQYVTERAPARGARLPAISAAAWDDDAFERNIFVKTGAAEALALTLRPARVGGHAIVVGTATDPYQPAERQFRITRRVLETLAQYHGLDVGIITKSPLVTRDIDVLRRLAGRGHVTINISLISTDVPLVRALEPRTPLPAVRLKALEQLAKAGLYAGVIMAPVVPGVTDDLPHVTAMVQAAKDAGAAFIHAHPLRLYANVRRRFLPVVAEHWPALLPRYEKAFDARGIVTPAYAAALGRRMSKVRKALGMGDGRTPASSGYRRTDGPTDRRTEGWPEVRQEELAL